MADTGTTSNKSEAKAGSTDYTRFIIVSGPRTGSHMLAQALNSSRDIVCFREVFNYLFDFVQFEVDGYDNSSARDLALREEHPLRFLDERIFGRHPEEIRAVGFKYHYEQGWAYRGLRERLVEDTDIRVVHLQRRNLLRMLVSGEIAAATGVWFVEPRTDLTLNGVLTRIWARLPNAVKMPLRAARRRLLNAPKRSQKSLTIAPEELRSFIMRTKLTADHFDKIFDQHPQLTVFYEDIVDHRDRVHGEVQEFIGVKPRRLTVTMRQQNPEPLRELLSNYDELFEAYRDSRHAWMFK